MNYDFLRGYTIPTHTTQGTAEPMPQPPPLPTALYGYCDGYDVLGTGAPSTANQTSAEPWNPSPPTHNAAVVSYPPLSNRYVPPGKHGTKLRPNPPTPRQAQKRKYNNGSGKSPQEVPAETTADGKMAIFHGRDPSYPDELNALIRALNCQLCNVQMNSFHSAKDHFESKAHDRNISGWLARNFTEKGLNPPEVKRFMRQGGPSGPDAFHCDLCDLKLTSLTHANQHYAGRKHRLVAGNISKPSGAGFYNSEGKWTRTGTRLTPAVDNDGRFGIGDQFKYESVIAAGSAAGTASTVPDTTTSADGEQKVSPAVVGPAVMGPAVVGPVAAAAGVSAAIAAPPTGALHCQLCNISVTSQGQMTMHLEGLKHRKKLKQSGIELPPLIPKVAATVEVSVPPVATSDSILESIGDSSSVDLSEDLSMYRTPTGSYYCKTCNMSMCHVSGLTQHMMGKKHIKKMADEKQAANKTASAAVAKK